MATQVKMAFNRHGTPQTSAIAASTELIFTVGAELVIAVITQAVWVRQGIAGLADASVGGAGCFLVPANSTYHLELVGDNDRVKVIQDAATAKITITPIKGSQDKS